MAKQRSPVEQTTFAQGLITEASPLTFPPNASLDELNFRITRSGNRRRRLGMGFEADYEVIDSGVLPDAIGRTVFNTYDWENVGGDPDKWITVVQVGRMLQFFDTLTYPLSKNLIGSYDTDLADDLHFTFATIDGILVVATGQREILTFTFRDGGIESGTEYLRIRDLFGVEDITAEGKDLTVGEYISYRPPDLTQAHLYNLRNQSFHTPKLGEWTDDPVDTIANFYETTTIVGITFDLFDGVKVTRRQGYYPSNADSVLQSFYPNVEKSSNRSADRFHAGDLIKNPMGTFQDAKGHFIIDALQRGPSRLEEHAKLAETHPRIFYLVTDLPEDTTPGGATLVTEFGGRAWFAGFNGEVVGGDKKSPFLSSYVMFSKLVQDPSEITKCYSEGDPTSRDFSDILETDGGFIRLDGAFGIVGLRRLHDSLIVLAKNGVWQISGGESGFKATDYRVVKISERGCNSYGSIIEVDGAVMYWGSDGIYSIAMSELGDYHSTNISQNSIQTLYNSISNRDKEFCTVAYDSYDRKVVWLYGNDHTADTPAYELVLDMNYGAFYPITLPTIAGQRPKPMCLAKVPPYVIEDVEEEIVVAGITVQSDSEDVYQSVENKVEGVREIAYLTLLDNAVTGTLQYTFSSYNNADFVDWEEYDGTGVDAEAYLLTGYLTGGDTQRKKTVNYMTTHMVRTEDGFSYDNEGNIIPENPSSCFLQSQWEWTDSAKAGMWSTPRQIYRYKRFYMPEDVNDTFDTGYKIMTSKNKIRGRGRAVSFLFKTEPKKDCQILGWSMIVGVESNV